MRKIMGVYFIFMAFAVMACIALLFCEIHKENKRHKEHKEYIQSIKVGDVFDWKDEPETKYTNPFDKKEDPSRIVVISDIKENGAGYKWVQYYYKHHNEPGFHSVDFYDEINSFVRYRKRIWPKDMEN